MNFMHVRSPLKPAVSAEKQTKRVTVASLMRKTVVIDENGVPDWSTLQESKTNGASK